MEDIFEVRNHGLENFLIYWTRDKKNVEEKTVDMVRESDSAIIEALEEIEEEGKYGFQYNIAYKATLRKYLLQTMGKQQVLKLLETIIEAFQVLKNKGVDEKYLYLNLDYIFVDFVTRDISFLCIPENTELTGNRRLRDFLKELLMTITYKEEEDIYYIAKLVLYISNNRCMDMENFEELVLSLKEVKITQGKPVVSPVTSFPAATMLRPVSRREEAEQENQTGGIKIEAAKPMPSGNLISYSQSGEHDETTVLTMPSGNLKEFSMEKRSLLQKNAEKKPLPVLIRTKTREKIIINKNMFRIGKSKSDTDYALEDNIAVSRVHAVIHKREGACYIRDNDSTNNTYVDGRILKGEKEQLLLKGMKISLADEEFIFELL